MASAGYLITWLLWGYLLELWTGGHTADTPHPRLRLSHKGRSPFQILLLEKNEKKIKVIYLTLIFGLPRPLTYT